MSKKKTKTKPDYREINQDVNNDDVLRKPRNWSGERKKTKDNSKRTKR